MALKYFLSIDGVAGDSTAKDHKGAFEIDGYDFDVSALVKAMGHGTGGGAGKTAFSPLTVNLDLDSSLTALLKDVASGKHIPAIELQGVSPDGKTLYDLKLGDVTVTKVHDSGTGQDQLSFSYSQVSLTTTPQDDNGKLGEPQTFEWNVAANNDHVKIADPKVPAGAVTGGDAQHFFLTIDGIAGDSAAKGHEGAFEVDGYSFDVSALMSAMGHGAGGGKTAFSPLTVDLDLDSGLTALLKDVASGKHIPSIELKGVSADGATVYDLKLGDVTVTKVHDSSTGHDQLSFSYGQVSLTTTPQDDNGKLGEPQSFAWNVTANSQNVKIADPNVPVDGDHHLNGDPMDAMEVLLGGPDKILTGHASHDTFIFTGNFGSNEITNFHHNQDHILLEKSHFGSAAEVLEHHAAEDGHGNTIITDPHNPANVIVLDQVGLSGLDVSDFVLL